MTKALRRRLSDDGLPLDGRLWTEEMFSILYQHMTQAKKEMREAYERHMRQMRGEGEIGSSTKGQAPSDAEAG